MVEDLILVCPYSGVNTDIPDLGIAYAATHLNAAVVDFNIRPRPRNRHLKRPAHTLGVSVRSLNYTEAQRLIAAYRKRFPDSAVKSVNGFLDIQCCYPYLELDHSISFDIPFSDAYPLPNYELFDSFDLLRGHWADGSWPYAIMTSQGCPFGCTYCASRRRKWRPRSAVNCRDELAQAQERWGIKRFVILDDCFNVDPKRVADFCELVAPLRLRWVCGNGLRADRLDEAMAKALAAAGCEALSFGVESTDPEVLGQIEKGETIEQIEAAVSAAKEHFDKVNGFFIIGLPGSSYESDLASLDWARRMGIDAHFSYHVPGEEALLIDSTFYGERAVPRSKAYPKEQQQRLYEMTAHMRPRGVVRSWWRRLGAGAATLLRLRGRQGARAQP